jgi:hypothetical protein
MDFSIRKEGLRILSNITGGLEGVNLKRVLAAMKSQGMMGRRPIRPGLRGWREARRWEQEAAAEFG